MKTMKKLIHDYCFLILGCLCLSLGIVVFFSHNQISAGGPPGIALLINHLFGVSIGGILLLVNLPLLLMGYKNFATNYKDGIISESNSYARGYTPALTNAVENSVSLTGGLSMAANYLGSGFNTGLTLNYLASQGVATVLDETELITLENKKSVFHAGGKKWPSPQTSKTPLQSRSTRLKIQPKSLGCLLYL